MSGGVWKGRSPAEGGDMGAILITGAAKRVGASIARGLADLGRPLALHCRSSEDEAAELQEEIARAGGAAQVFIADLMSEAEAEALVGRAADALGAVTCLINNASLFEHDTPQSATRESWDRHMAVNLRGPFVLSQGLLKQLPEGAGANIINIIDQRVLNLTPHFTSYSVSKYALWGLTQSLARALAPRVRVNAIGPGPTLPSARQSDADFEAQWRAMPLERAVNADEIAKAIRFILDAPSMTGQMIALDSGQHLGWAPPEGDAVLVE